MAVIIPKHGTTAPTTGLTQYEIAIDTTNKRVYVGNSGGAGDLIGSAPGGSDTYVQFNDGGLLGGDAGLTYNKTTDSLTMAGDLAVNGGDITTSTTTATIFNTTATTVTAFGAATTCNLGYSGSNSSTTNIATGSLNAAQIKTINIGTGAATTRITNINLGNGGAGGIYLNGGTTFIGDNSGLVPGTLSVDTIVSYTSLGTINIDCSVGSNINLNSTGDISIGDTGYNSNVTTMVISDPNRNVQISAINGVWLNSQTELRYYDANSSNYVGFKAPATITTDKIWTLPSADGTSGQFLSTNGSGVLSWSTGTAGPTGPAGANGTNGADGASPQDFILFTMGII